MPDATPQQIKKAYYNCMKACHPDLSGNDPDVTNFCMFINEVYAVGSQYYLLYFYNACLIYFGKISCVPDKTLIYNVLPIMNGNFLHICPWKQDISYMSCIY